MQAMRSSTAIREVNARYHDIAAADYDSKWGIDFGEIGQAQVLGKLRKLLGRELDPDGAGTGYAFPRALEVGAGTGYFSLNLLRAGVVGEVTCTDISAGMVRTLKDNAERLGLDRVRAQTADAASLPFGDESFDLVMGHAVLHHLPDLGRAFAEFHRVLAPGGRIAFAGEPSAVGDRASTIPKHAARVVAPLWRTALRARPADSEHPTNGHHDELCRELEPHVDVHAFSPEDLAGFARLAGFKDVSVRGEELTANWFGWFNRALEASARDSDVPMLWRRYAFGGYLTLQRVDARLLEPHLPAAIFYNLLLTGRREPREVQP
jgi:SAM-dependent methyltransferase